MTRIVTAADMMQARDAVARAYNAMVAADAAWSTNPSEMTNARQASTRKVWSKAVRQREAMERRMWAQQDQAA